jgi:hypothetical protein
LEEYVDAIGRYEIALKFVTPPYDQVPHLIEEFRKSIKQAKLRY